MRVDQKERQSLQSDFSEQLSQKTKLIRSNAVQLLHSCVSNINGTGSVYLLDVGSALQFDAALNGSDGCEIFKVELTEQIRAAVEVDV